MPGSTTTGSSAIGSGFTAPNSISAAAPFPLLSAFTGAVASGLFVRSPRAVGSSLYPYTKLHLRGADAVWAGDISDYSPLRSPVVLGGGVSVQDGWINFNGVDAYLDLPPPNGATFGTSGDTGFFVSLSVLVNAYPAGDTTLMSSADLDGGLGFSIKMSPTGAITFRLGTYPWCTTTPIELGGLVKVCVWRKGSSYFMSAHGANTSSYVVSAGGTVETIPVTTGPITLGATTGMGARSGFFAGYMADARVVSGSATAIDSAIAAVADLSPGGWAAADHGSYVSSTSGHPMGNCAVTGPSPTVYGYSAAISASSSLTGTFPTLYAQGHDSYGEKAAFLTAPSPTLSANGGANGALTAPVPALAATGTVTIWGSATLSAPAATLGATGTVSSMATSTLSAPSPNLIGYSGAVCSVTLTDSPTLLATGTAGSIGGAALTCPLFELTAGATAQNHGSANLLAPSPRMGVMAQAWLIAPGATLTAIGHAVVTATYEAYAVNLNHNDPASHDEVTRYTNFPFTQIVRYQGSYFGVAADGLYLLEGTTDDGAVIPWAFKTTMTDFKSPFRKTVVSAYFGGRLGTAATVHLHPGEDGAQAYNYASTQSDHAQNYRQKFGRGLDARYFALGASGTGALELDNIEFNTLNSTRRI